MEAVEKQTELKSRLIIELPNGMLVDDATGIIVGYTTADGKVLPIE